MAKQTFTTGQVLTAAQMTSLQQTAMLGGDANARTASYVLAASDAGNAVSMNSSSATTITVNTGIFAAGDIVTIINLGTGVCTITAGTATVATAGSLALAQNEGGILRFTSASAAIFFEFATPQTGDITAVTTGANSGLTGGATSGAADLRINTSAKGSLMVGSGASTLAELTVGTNGHTLVADSSTATGLKWAAAAGGGLTLLSTTTLSGSSTSITSISQSYTELYIVITDYYLSADGNVRYQLNGDTNQNYRTATYNNTSTFGSANTETAGYVGLDIDNVNNPNIALLRIANYSGATYHFIEGLSFFKNLNANTWMAYPNLCYYLGTSAISSIQINASTGTFSGGTVKIYGA